MNALVLLVTFFYPVLPSFPLSRAPFFPFALLPFSFILRAMIPKVKICCISSHREAELAIGAGAHALGLVGPMPSGPGVIEDQLIADIAQRVRGVETFLLTSETSASGVVDHHNRVNTSTIQIVDRIETGGHRELRRQLPGVDLVQVIHVIGEESLDDALEAAEFADYVLLDSGNPNLAVKELGGTGRTHNWEVSRKIVEQSPKPVFLAGGLNPQNIKKAVDAVQPFGVDVCSGLRSDGELDPGKVEEFFARLNE